MFSPMLRTCLRISYGRIEGRRAWSALTTNNSSLTVHSLNATFPYIWLRDSCQSPRCIHPTTRQKLHQTSDIPIDIRPVHDGVKITDDGIQITWVDGHESIFHTSFLERHSSSSKLSMFHKDIEQERWDNATISKSHDLFISYKALQTPAGLLSAITHLSRYGLLFISEVPNEETAGDTCELLNLAQLFGDIRPTFYGRLWDVINIHNGRNMAYTNLGLGLHMDLLYFEHPPRYQILHCLRNRVLGGNSTFVDGLHAAETLRKTHPSDFDILAKTPVPFHYINDGHHLHHEHPTIELTGLNSVSSQGKIAYINYSPPFQAPLLLSTPPLFYTALQRFAKLLNDPLSTYRYMLREGDAVLFDNRRVLHARTAFSEVEGREVIGEANRWLKGCYLEADALMDKERMLRT